MKRYPGSELTQLACALKLKLQRTVEQEAYVSMSPSLNLNTNENSARAVPLIRLEDVRHALLGWPARLTLSL